MPKPKLTHVRYVEPGDGGGHCEVYLTKDQAVAIQQKVADAQKYIYASPDAALKDFMVTHWADLVMDPKERDDYMKRMEEVINVMSADFAGFATSHSWVRAILEKAHYIMYPENKPKDTYHNDGSDKTS